MAELNVPSPSRKLDFFNQIDQLRPQPEAPVSNLLAKGAVDLGGAGNLANDKTLQAWQALRDIRSQVNQSDKLCSKAKDCMHRRIAGVEKGLNDVVQPGVLPDLAQGSLIKDAMRLGDAVQKMPGASPEMREALACG